MKLTVMTLPLLPMPNIPGLPQEKKAEPTLSLLDIYTAVKEAGAEAVDIASIDFQFGGEAAVLEALERTGLKCSCYLAFIGAPMPTEQGNREAVAQGKAAVDQTLRLGSKVMMFVPAGNQEAVAVMSRQELAEGFAAVLRPVVEYAAENGVTVVIEDAPHREFPMCSEAELRYLLEAVPGLKLVYDSGNMLHADEDPVEYYDHLAQYAAHAHLKDIGRSEDGKLMECRHGDGSVNFPVLFDHMKGNGFDGYMAIELAPEFGSQSSVKERVQYAVEYFKAIL